MIESTTNNNATTNGNKIGYMINESALPMVEFTVTEDTRSSINRVTGTGILQTGNEKNRNGRMYRTEDLIREINAPRQRELIAAGQLLSEVSHPLAANLVRQQTIDPRNSCARFLKLWNEGDNIMGTFQGTNNDFGETFDKDLRMGVRPAFSLRALGTIKATPMGAVVENLKMITYDYVIFPSHPHAYTQGLLNESASILEPQSNFKLTDANDATKSFIKEFTNADVVKAIEQQAASMNESAIDFIKDKSFNFHLLKEAYDMTHFDTIDFIDARHIALTEAGNATIVMNVEDYIAKEIQNYIG